MNNYNPLFEGSIYLIAFITCTVFSCQEKDKSELVWEASFPVIGSQSSPRTVDLNRDGVLDVVMGAGKNEFEYSDYGILAINGDNGELLWNASTVDQVYGSATFHDVNKDGIPDIFIGGRGPHLKGIDGQTGDLIWEYDSSNYLDHPILKHARFNFNNSVLVPDQNGNGIPELLISNGGNARAAPFETVGRYPGVLMVIDALSGKILAADSMPDGKETYMSPLLLDKVGNNETMVVFGTGGETISGSLFIAKLKDLMNNDLSNARVLVTEQNHGFIAPPVLADLDRDGILDIVAISHASTITAFSGKSFEVLWQQQISGTESSNSLAVGQFTADNIPDLFTFVSKGVWPENTGSIQVLIDGKTGVLINKKELGCTGFSSPIAYDLNKDGRDEVIFSINEYDCDRAIDDKSAFLIENKLLLMDFKSGEIHILDQSKGFKNIFSTPWLGDLDGDGYLDLIHCQYFSHTDILSFLGMKIKRIDLPITIRNKPDWGAFMGSEGNGIYPK
ncbi:FG-GAP-like repeat-containing protein [Cyclobacterium plantarum]|uniref:FG-GAP-like repeat-containing protein n=1 Tax=Cyclobacterium plantarum TaxID=2716263 RepID=UPI003F70B89D